MPNMETTVNENPPVDSSTDGATPAASSAATEIDPDVVREAIIEMLKSVHDPEIPVNIYELGLIYEVAVRADGYANIKMTLTAPSCPAAGMLPGEVQTKAGSVPGVRDVKVELVWEPAWDQSKMSEAARLQLGLV